DFTARPCPDHLDRLARPRVFWLHRLEQMQDMFRTSCCPQGEQFMVSVCQRSPAAYGDKPGVPFLWQYHSKISCSSLLPVPGCLIPVRDDPYSGFCVGISRTWIDACCQVRKPDLLW